MAKRKQSAVDREWADFVRKKTGCRGEPLCLVCATSHTVITITRSQLAAIIRRARKAALQEAIDEVDADSLRTDYDHPIKWARDAVERVKP